MTARTRTLEPRAADVLAAGAVLWRHGADGVEVAVVHRPRYDDWSFPKGKLDPGETMPFAAVREVEEETGQTCRLGAFLRDVRYEVADGGKLVRYWAAEARGGEFVPGEETDELRWLAPAAARAQLSYAHDARVLDRFVELGPPSSVIVLVRHARAGSRNQWDGDDDLRPLSGSGQEQAQQLGRLLALFGPERIVTAPPLRCRQTVEPLAEALGLPIAEEPLVGEHTYWLEPQDALARTQEIAGKPGVTTVSSQGGVIPDLVGMLVESAELAGVDQDDIQSRKASTWLLTFGPDATCARPTTTSARPARRYFFLPFFGLSALPFGPFVRPALLPLPAFAGACSAANDATGSATAETVRLREWAAGTLPPTASRNPVPGRKAGTVMAGTSIGSPVRGLRPTLAARDRPSNTPKPGIVTEPPDRTVSTMVCSNPSTAAAAVRRSPRRAASASTSWVLFMDRR
ncbi:hypothetical protein BJF78_19790 [Pseudonocardia sp. CNS-139]|nr:hypothetical protein BJF78_19790 [Pseudonocardia sp. CNS-139]